MIKAAVKGDIITTYDADGKPIQHFTLNNLRELAVLLGCKVIPSSRIKIITCNILIHNDAEAKESYGKEELRSRLGKAISDKLIEFEKLLIRELPYPDFLNDRGDDLSPQSIGNIRYSSTFQIIVPLNPREATTENDPKVQLPSE